MVLFIDVYQGRLTSRLCWQRQGQDRLGMLFMQRLSERLAIFRTKHSFKEEKYARGVS
jgi:hypothetical protein